MRSEKNTGQKVLKERIKGNNIRHETVGHMDSFTENKSIALGFLKAIERTI